MSESTLLSELQTVLRTTALYDDQNVTVNDHTGIDISMNRLAVIETSDDFDFAFRDAGVEAVFEIMVTLYEPFVDYEETYNTYAQARQEILTALLENDLDTGVIQGVRSGTPIGQVSYDDNTGQTLPVFLVQRLIVTVIDYG